MNKSICNLFLFIILLVLAVLFLGCEKKPTLDPQTDAGPYKHWGEPKDSVYGVSYYPHSNSDVGCGCAAWVDNKRNAIYKIKWGDSLYYVTRVKHKNK